MKIEFFTKFGKGKKVKKEILLDGLNKTVIHLTQKNSGTEYNYETFAVNMTAKLIVKKTISHTPINWGNAAFYWCEIITVFHTGKDPFKNGIVTPLQKWREGIAIPNSDLENFIIPQKFKEFK